MPANQYELATYIHTLSLVAHLENETYLFPEESDHTVILAAGQLQVSLCPSLVK